MSTIVVIQARTGSTRLPGKVLADVGGQPMLGFMLDRLAGLPWPVVVATSDRTQDDTVAEIAARYERAVVRGSEDDVLGRFALTLTAHPADVIVRLTADCPLTDPALIEAVVEARAESDADYASNTVVRCFPDGLDVEVLTAEALRKAIYEATDPDDREHVTSFIWRHPRRFSITQVVTDPPRGLERWTVDTRDDLERVRAIVARCPGETDWAGVLDAVGATERPARLPVPGIDAHAMTLIDLPAPEATPTTDLATHGALT